MEGKWKGIDKRTFMKALAFSFAFLIVSGLVSTTIPNNIFVRMVPLNIFDYVFWIATSLLLLPLAYAYFSGPLCKTCEMAAGGGTFGGVLAFSCPICSKLLVLLLGLSGALAFDSYRPIIGFLSIILLLYAIYITYWKGLFSKKALP